MKKQDLIIIAVLFALLMAWPFFYTRWIKPIVSPPVAGQFHTNRVTDSAANIVPPPKVSEVYEQVSEQAVIKEAGKKTLADKRPVVEPEAKSPVSNVPEKLVAITNSGTLLVVSSKGGGIVSVEFDNYRETVAKNSGPMVLSFTNMPALGYKGINDLSGEDDFSILSVRGNLLVIESANTNGLKLIRTLELNDINQVIVSDLFTNTGAYACSLPKHSIQVGPMQLPADEYRMRGMNYLGIDVLESSGGEGVIHWSGKLAKLFKAFKNDEKSAFLPKSIVKQENIPVDWVAVKNKFFTQILVPDGGGIAYRIIADRVTIEGEDQNPALKPKRADIKSVAVSVIMPEKTLAGGESFNQTFKLYLGPKKYSVLRTLGLHQEDVMEFGMWSPVCKFLLTVLNITYDFIPNYGVAIIVLTLLIRIIFWPLTHKSTESMKRMQELQPLMTALKAKHKDSPKKMQEETMALYRKHKVNPVSGCLPMLVQIPVFIALFIVLRSAIEMRFAPFLWISDLSAPERLFADILPIPLNILPIFMAATQVWQQTLMPATDPNQQKIMMFFMPAIMLVMFYMMPSALVLYWSANQCIVIIQQLIQKRKRPVQAVEKK